MPLSETIIGNEKVAMMLEKSYKSGKLSHAYLFEGQEYVGKKKLVLGFCKMIFDDKKENIEKNLDLIILRPDKDSGQITIEEIRNLEKKLSLYPHSSKYKVAIIEQAETMNKSAANALLKTIEEPNKTTIVILLTSNSKNILQTIKSRCQIFKFFSVKKEFLEKKLLSKINSLSEVDKIIKISGCRPEMAIELANDSKKTMDMENQMERIFEIVSKNEEEKISEAEVFFKREPSEIISIMDLWVIRLRLCLIDYYSGGQNEKKYNMLKIKRRIELIRKIKEDLLTKNVNTKLALENLFIGL